MTINNLTISNFKGIGDTATFDIRPITLFVGANSSGKSTCLHALMSLAQTLKLGNSAPALVLDDDFAHVHLGRFVEIAHSHSYADSIAIGVTIGDRTFPLPRQKGTEATSVEGLVRAEYSFKSTLRTQEVYVESAKLSVGDRSYQVRRGSKRPYSFQTTDEPGKRRFETQRSGNFLFQLVPSPQFVTQGGDTRAWFESYWLFDFIQREIESELRGSRYLGPFRQSPLRRYPFRGSTANEVGAQGEATITLLASEYVQSKDRAHIRRVNRWLTEMGLAKSVELSRVGTSDLFDVSLKLADGVKLPIADLGYGLSQVLPVLTQCTFANHGDTLLFEQPELHLHENAARKLAYVFRETVAEKKAHVIIETHSKELVYELLSEVKQRRLAVDDLAIYTVERVKGASSYKRVGLELQGNHLEIDDPWVQTLTAR
jgi:hypothetical protein